MNGLRGGRGRWFAFVPDSTGDPFRGVANWVPGFYDWGMMWVLLHAVVRWVSAVFTGIEAFKRGAGWPEESFGLLFALCWLVITLLLIAPEVRVLLEKTQPLNSLLARLAPPLGLASAVTCACLSVYLIYLTSGGPPMPGEHF